MTANINAAAPVPSDKVLDRIKKMLALANGNAAGGEQERDTAMKMALKLLAKYNLDMADVSNSTVAEDRISHQDTFYAYPWMRYVANAVAELYFCKFFSTPIPQYKRIFTFVGLESNAMAALEVTRYIIKSIQKEALRERKARNEGEPFENSFLNAAGATISHRCHDIKDAEIAEAEAEKEKAKKEATAGQAAIPLSTSTALALANVYEKEKKENELYVAEKMGIKLVTNKSKARSTNSAGVVSGTAYANKINLSKGTPGAKKIGN